MKIYEELKSRGLTTSLRHFSKEWLGKAPNYVSSKADGETYSLRALQTLHGRLLAQGQYDLASMIPDFFVWVLGLVGRLRCPIMMPHHGVYVIDFGAAHDLVERLGFCDLGIDIEMHSTAVVFPDTNSGVVFRLHAATSRIEKFDEHDLILIPCSDRGGIDQIVNHFTLEQPCVFDFTTVYFRSKPDQNKFEAALQNA